MPLNAVDGDKGKHIMVQLLEVCDENREAYQAGYKNLCEITKERIRCVGEKILEDAMRASKDFNDLDIGFKVFKAFLNRFFYV